MWRILNILVTYYNRTSDNVLFSSFTLAGQLYLSALNMQIFRNYSANIELTPALCTVHKQNKYMFDIQNSAMVSKNGQINSQTHFPIQTTNAVHNPYLSLIKTLIKARWDELYTRLIIRRSHRHWTWLKWMRKLACSHSDSCLWSTSVLLAASQSELQMSVCQSAWSCCIPAEGGQTGGWICAIFLNRWQKWIIHIVMEAPSPPS